MLAAVQHLIDAAQHNKRKRVVGNHSFRLYNNKWEFLYHFTIVCLVDPINNLIAYDNGGYDTISTIRAIRSYKDYFNSNYIECSMEFLKTCK